MTRAFCALAASRSATVSAAAAATAAAASAYAAQADCLQPLFVVCASWGLLWGRGSDIALPSLALRLRGGEPRRTSARLARPPGPRGVNGLQSDELKCVSRRGGSRRLSLQGARTSRRPLRPPPLTE